MEVNRDGEKLVLRPEQLVLATGMSGVPNMPDIPGMETFKGEQQHSSQHPGGEAYKGKRVVVLGASELVADGEIKLKSGVTIERVNPESVTLSDGTELPADLIVYATGYGSMNGWAAKFISQEVAGKVGKCWGMGSGTTKDPGPWEGELRNMWKPTQQPGLWFHGGNLHQSRHYSRYLSMQLKARMEGIETPIYGMEEVHHLS